MPSSDWESGPIVLLTVSEVQKSGKANSLTVLLHACALHCTAYCLLKQNLAVLLCVWLCFLFVLSNTLLETSRSSFMEFCI
jgi:hypothetical protein